MYQPPYKTVYKVEVKDKKKRIRNSEQPLSGKIVRTRDLFENEIEKQKMSSRFHFEARTGSHIKS